MGTGGGLNIKMPSYQYGDSHVKDKTVSPTVLSLTWESPYLEKTVFLLRWGPGYSIVSVNPQESLVILTSHICYGTETSAFFVNVYDKYLIKEYL